MTQKTVNGKISALIIFDPAEEASFLHAGGNDRIHFEQSESADGEHWSVKDSDDEVRVKTAK